MTDREWAEFCDLLHKIVNLPVHTYDEKKEEVLKRCEEFNGCIDLEEFVAWFDGYEF